MVAQNVLYTHCMIKYLEISKSITGECQVGDMTSIICKTWWALCLDWL